MEANRLLTVFDVHGSDKAAEVLIDRVNDIIGDISQTRNRAMEQVRRSRLA